MRPIVPESVQRQVGSLSRGVESLARRPATASGSDGPLPSETHRLISAASTNAGSVRSTLGFLTGYYVANLSSSPRYVKLYDTASSPTVGTDTPKVVIALPPNSAANVGLDSPVHFSQGIGRAIVTGIADSDATAVGANEVVVNLFHRDAVISETVDPGEFGEILEAHLANHITLEDVYPIGSVYTSVVSTSPATLFGFGTWARIAQGRMLVGQDSGDASFDTAEETGGAKTVALATGELPAHTHGAGSYAAADHAHALGIFLNLSPDALGSNTMAPAGEQSGSGTGNSGALTVSGTSGSTGSGTAHQNLPPYLVVYIWKRTA